MVLSARLWRSHFGADPAIVGKAIPLDRRRYVVVGVAPDEFQPRLSRKTPGSVRLWAAGRSGLREQRTSSGYWQVVGRLKDGVSLVAAQAEMDAVSAQVEAENPRANKGMRASIISIREHLVGDVRPAVGLFARCRVCRAPDRVRQCH